MEKRVARELKRTEWIERRPGDNLRAQGLDKRDSLYKALGNG